MRDKKIIFTAETAKGAEKRLKKILATDPHGRTRTLGLRPFEERFALGLRLEAKKKAQSRRSAVLWRTERKRNSAHSHRGVGPPYGPEAVSSVRDKKEAEFNYEYVRIGFTHS